MDHSPSASVGRPEIVQKVTRRLIPFVGICYLIAYIDRQNVSFAKLQMVGDLGVPPVVGAALRPIATAAIRSWDKHCDERETHVGFWSHCGHAVASAPMVLDAN